MKRMNPAALRGAHIVLVVACVVIVALTVYNYFQSGRFNASSVVVALLLLTVVAVQWSSARR